ncbi:hypothetical protein [Candidatus Poriferisodalis sp.]|uniref:hypothetical protein n=1 Tax=Candidatus Poriferisodalis sp. TaxID=3101277 RepID=UPI003D1518D2
MASDVVLVRLWLSRLRMLEVAVDAPERLAVRVAEGSNHWEIDRRAVARAG